MFFKVNDRKNILKVDDSFALLFNERQNGDLTFDFSYSVSQIDVVRAGTFIVNVSIFAKTVSPKNILENSFPGLIDSRSLINNILSQIQDAKTSNKEQQTLIIANRKSDVSAKINNEIIPQLRAGVHPTLIPQLYQTSLRAVTTAELKAQNDDRPILSFIAHQSITDLAQATSASIDLDTRHEMFDMIVRQGIDPSYITQLTHRSIPAQFALGGLARRTRAPEYDFDPAIKLLNHHVM